MKNFLRVVIPIVSEKRPVEIIACFLCAYTVMCAYDWIHVFVHIYTYILCAFLALVCF